MVRKAVRLTLQPLEDRSTPALLPAGFEEVAVATGLRYPTAMELAPNGDLWVLQQSGIVKRFKPGSTTADVVGDVKTLGLDASGERGLLGIAFDPQYASNKFVYLYYTATVPNAHNRVARFRVNDSNPNDYYFEGTSTTGPDAGTSGTPTPTVILDLPPLSIATNHNGGAIHFGPDGKLYVAVGDNFKEFNSQTLSNRLGKVLRINADGTIPTDNPFFNTAAGVNRSIWALGLRNPYTFAFEPGTGRMFINDVGRDTWEEINQGVAGANYGWPYTEGDTGTPPKRNGTYEAPIYTYRHGNGVFQGHAITGGTFYDPATASFPSSYAGKYFFADYVSGWIHVLDPATGTASQFATGAGGPVDLHVTADGRLLYLSRNTGSVFAVQYTGTTAPGLKAEFFDYTTNLSALPELTGRTTDVVRSDLRVNYPATLGHWVGLDARFRDTFAVRETGYLSVPADGTYTLYLKSNDGSKLWLDGQPVIDNDGIHQMRERSVTLTLTAGKHALQIEAFENVGPAGLVLSWSGPGFGKEVIPAGRLLQDA